MTSPDEFIDRIGAIVGGQATDERVKKSYKWNDYQEAKKVLSEIRGTQKELRLLKREVSASIKDIKSHYSSANTAVGKGAGSVAAGLIFGSRTTGKMNAARRDQLRREKEETLRPYSYVKDVIDDILLQFDQIKHDVESSEEYMVRPKPKRARAKKSSGTLKAKGRRYYAYLSGEVKGPFTVEELEGLMKAHVATPETQLCIEGEQDWHNLSHFFDA